MPKAQHPWEFLTQQFQQYNARLVAVSKTRSVEDILVLYNKGQRCFAENRVQELILKAPVLPADIEWHLIGHLQTNKVRQVLPYVHCIQSLDREKLWKTLHEEAQKINQPIRCLLQIKIAREASKYGWDYEALDIVLRSGIHRSMPFVIPEGVMGMATLTEDTDQIRREMRQLKVYFDQLKENYFLREAAFNTISMGMSGDYGIALEEGSNMLRIGTLLFP